MLRPFDVLRKTKTPIGPGQFDCKSNGCLHVVVVTIDRDRAMIVMGDSGNSQLGVDSESARVLSAFFGELADQFEGKTSCTIG